MERKRKERHAATLQIDYRAILEDSPMPKTVSQTPRQTMEAEKAIIDRPAPSRTPALTPSSISPTAGNDVISALQRQIKGLADDIRSSDEGPRLQEHCRTKRSLLQVLELNGSAKPARQPKCGRRMDLSTRVRSRCCCARIFISCAMPAYAASLGTPSFMMPSGLVFARSAHRAALIDAIFLKESSDGVTRKDREADGSARSK